jgi:hypothetical protein
MASRGYTGAEIARKLKQTADAVYSRVQLMSSGAHAVMISTGAFA